MSRSRRRLRVTLAVALAAAAGCTTPSPPDAVPVAISYSRFQPDRVTVPAGTRVRFDVANADPIDHELIIGSDAVQQAHELGSEPNHAHRDCEVSVAAGEHATTSYTFDRPGTVPYGCHLPGHWAYGMRGVVQVVQE